jgi:type II secretory pathway pseudopilin PulG
MGVIPLGVGAFLGYQAAYLSSLGGFGGGMGAAFLVYAIVGLVLIAILVGLGNALRAAGRGRAASRYAFAAAALIAAGAGGGGAAVPAFDLGYHPPVVLQARGEASVTLDGVPTFVPSASGRANCQSTVAGKDVAGVTALSLGDFDGNVLRAGVSLPAEGASGGHVSLFVDTAHLPPGSVVPMWDTDDVEIQSSSNRASGSIRFTDAAIRVDPETGAPASSWPKSLSGEITWSCGPWFQEGAPGAPTVAGQITLDLLGVDWVGDPRGTGTCDFEADGSVWTVASDQVGSLQGQPMSMSLGLLGDPRAGDEVDLMLSVHLPAPSDASSLPIGALVAATSGRGIAWADLVTIGEISPDGLNGSLAFTDLPIPGTPDPAWPQTLSGELSWECG